MPIKTILLTLLLFLCVLLTSWYFLYNKKEPVKVGILHSLTGDMAEYEKKAVDAALLAIEEINKDDGVLDRQLKPIIADGASDSATFAKEAERLITEEKVSVIFGGWRSADRKAMKPIVEKYKNLLFYPVQHEGLEESPNIVYTSAIPNQQAIPATTWCLQNLGTKIFIVGTNELFSRANVEIIKDTVLTYGGEVVGVELVNPSETDATSLVEKVLATQPQVIINSMIGPINVAFFTGLRNAGITSEKIPTMSLTIDEPELQKYGAEYMTGNYSCWSHFQSIERIENTKFVQKMKNRYGQEYVVSDATEASYFGVYLWTQAIYRKDSFKMEDVISSLHNQSFNAPEGIVSIDNNTLHTWSMSCIGKIRSDKQFTVVWSSEKAVPPRAYPLFKTPQEWDALVLSWYKEWGNKWSSE